LLKHFLPGFNKSRECFEADERKNLFEVLAVGGEWRACPTRGRSFYPLNLLTGFLNEPLVLVRKLEFRIEMLQQTVCTHRGNILVQNPGKHKKDSCVPTTEEALA
jgi:choline monooxygenase